jgi:hypothetical protein
VQQGEPAEVIAVLMTVQPRASRSSVAVISASVAASSAEAASSSTSTAGSRTKHAGDRQALALTAGEAATALADRGLVPLGQALNEVAHPGRAGG